MAGVVFPADASGKRSTIAGGKTVWSAAARAVDPKLADAIAAEKDWRNKYEPHLVRLMEAGSVSVEAAVNVAAAGLDAVYSTFEFVRDGKSVSLAEAMANPAAAAALSTASVKGTSAPNGKLVVPYEGKSLESDALVAEIKKWASAGAMEPGVEAAIAGVINGGAPALDLSGKVFVILGATSALGPLQQLLQWGATVIGVARKKPKNWADLIAYARTTNGTLVFPVSGGAPAAGASDAELAAAAGADLMTDTPELLAWLTSALAQLQCASPTIGMYTYLDSDAHVRVSIACDLIMKALATMLPRAKLAFIQTPSLVYGVPEDSIAAAKANYESSLLSYLGYSSNARPAVPGTSPPRYVHDGLVGLQGPNYALAKMIQLWRAVLARSRDGLCVSANMAPAARTASMVAGDNKNASRVATGLNGMGYFKPLVCFDQETVSACMAALLVHDVSDVPGAVASPSTPLSHPYDLFSHQAFHGGSFRVGVKPGELGKLFYLSGTLFGPASAL